MRALVVATLSVGVLLGAAPPVGAETAGDEELARQLANPIASLISVPFQSNWERGIGPRSEGDRWRMNIQPVVPFDMNADYNLISRVILPVVSQSDIFPGAGSQSGLSDTLVSLFVSPKKPTAGGMIWGAGPIFLVPTGTDDLLSAKKWGLGPTGVALTQTGPWTYGVLGNHIWSVAGSSSRPSINSSFVQPFVSYNLPTATSFTLQAEATYDWRQNESSVPVTALAAQIVRIGGLPVQFAAGPRYYVSSAANGPRGWGARANVTLLFPR